MQKTNAKVCAVITEETVKAAGAAMARAASQADMIEVRLDYLRDFDFRSLAQLEALLSHRTLPTIITCRSVEEGGRQKISNSIRLPLLLEGAKRFADYSDIEAAHYEAAAKWQPDISRLIVSYHDFQQTPENLHEIYNWITRLPAAIHKIAVRAKQITDSLAIFSLLERARRDDRKFIAIAMNEAGVITRLLGCLQGSFLTYGTLEDSEQSAPGQLSCRDLTELYRINNVTAATQIMGIIGNPVSHSLSPLLHNTMFAAHNLNAIYLPLEVADVEDFFKRLVKPQSREIALNFRGFSVTIPHKTAVIPLLDTVHPTAAQIGAVNTIVIEDGKLLGYNTDVDGAMQPLEKLVNPAGESCAVIGSGGAARAIIYGLLQRQAAVTIYARNLIAAAQLEEEFAVPVLPLEKLQANKDKILINTTPVGMRGFQEGESIIPAGWLEKHHIVYDLVYNPLQTRLLKDSQAAGCLTISGLDMLIAQACLQFQLWTGKSADYSLMYQAAFAKLSCESESALA